MEYLPSVGYDTNSIISISTIMLYKIKSLFIVQDKLLNYLFNRRAVFLKVKRTSQRRLRHKFSLIKLISN